MMERKMAEQIVTLVNGYIDQLIATLEPVEAAVSPDEFAAYKRGVAKAINALDFEIVQRVALEHPDLLPADDDAEHPDDDAEIPKSKQN
jgi:hypothetical protein